MSARRLPNLMLLELIAPDFERLLNPRHDSRTFVTVNKRCLYRRPSWTRSRVHEVRRTPFWEITRQPWYGYLGSGAAPQECSVERAPPGPPAIRHFSRHRRDLTRGPAAALLRPHSAGRQHRLHRVVHQPKFGLLHPLAVVFYCTVTPRSSILVLRS